MCVAALAWHAHPHWRLVAIGNRDEYHERPAAPLDRWHDADGVIAGQDLQSGGTWLGVSADRFVLVTNLRGYDLPNPDRASRGGLVTDLLGGGEVQTDALDAYNPFNLLLACGEKLTYLTNRPAPTRTTLPHGIYGLSNGSLDEPWPKTLHLKAALNDWLAVGTADPAPLFSALRSEILPDIGLHPQAPSEVAIEPAETPPFISGETYGTRCSTVVLVDPDGAGRIIERRFDAAATPIGETQLVFAWPVRV